MGYAWLEEAGLIAGTPEWEERECRAFAGGEEGGMRGWTVTGVCTAGAHEGRHLCV